MAKRRKAGKAKRKWTWPRLPWPRGGGALVATAWAAGAAGLAVAWVMGVPRLEAYASGRHEEGEVTVRFVDVPAWVAPELEAVSRVLGRDVARARAEEIRAIAREMELGKIILVTAA